MSRVTTGWLLGLVALLNGAVLVLTAGHQIYDTNFYALFEATALLAGDHPYRDFFEWGVPLQAAISACGQLIAGNRLIGEFAIQWLGIVVGAVVSFHLGLRLSGSIGASLITLAFSIPILAATATYHYPKLLLYPMAVWLIWRYMDAPSLRSALFVGVITAVAFLFRHDHGAYIAAGSALGFCLTRSVAAPSRSLRYGVLEGGVAAATALAVLAPWMLLVHTSEGLPEYWQWRYERYALVRHHRNPYPSLLTMNPIRTLNAAGLDLPQLSDLQPRLPPSAEGVLWLQQVALLVPLCALGAAGVNGLRSRRLRERAPIGTDRLVVAATLLAVAQWRLFMDPGYVTVVAPLTGALGTYVLSRRVSAGTSWPQQVWRVTRFGLVAGMLCVTAVATFLFTRSTHIFTPARLAATVPDTFVELIVSPPIDGFAPREEVFGLDQSTWNKQEVHAVRVLLRYLHDCTDAGDRILVTGQTPHQVGYYVGRPIAGGHLFWHDGWRSDPSGEQQSLALLQRQSVPFAYSTHDPVVNDFRRYPRIREYLLKHSVELEGSRGLVLVDTRRQPAGTFGDLGFPCFRRGLQ